MPQPTGQLIDGKYQLVEVAGEGGMATVYRAVQKGAAGFQRQVAIKHIKPEYRALTNYVDRFIEEARVGSELAHPNIVQVHDFVAQEGSYYLVMEWVEGIDLGHFIRVYQDAGKHVEWALAVAIGIGTLRGLGAAHERRAPNGELAPVIHRDVTPHNILLGGNGVVKLTDFGLARARDRVASMTAPGTVKGKLSYLAPEVSFGKANTPLSDIFHVGSVLWETLAGERLFDGKNDVEIFKKIRACKVPPIIERRPDVPASLVAVLDVALDPDPNNRYNSATAMAHALAQVMKQAVGIDPQSALGQAVRDMRAKLRGGDIDVQFSADIDLSTADFNVEPIELVNPKKTKPPG
ncbi:MAG: serine/threonine protein kinase [Kofleriaceae bacterium]|nr:serine/threonine protein kinase [Kofleriaceae bacterium]